MINMDSKLLSSQYAAQVTIAEVIQYRSTTL